jgi:hypothetical protein
MHLSLDPMVVDPRCSDPMDHICTSPLRFLWSLDVDLMVIAFSPDPMVLIHFGFRASGNSTFKLPILRSEIPRTVTSSQLLT